jgi:hypothetical protein
MRYEIKSEVRQLRISNTLTGVFPRETARWTTIDVLKFLRIRAMLRMSHFAQIAGAWYIVQIPRTRYQVVPLE